MALIVCCLSFSGCYSTLIMEKSNNYSANAKDLKKIVFIDPSLMISDGRKANDMRYFSSGNREEKLVEIIKSSADKNNIKAEVIDKENLSGADIDFFNYLIPIRNEVLNSILMCEVEYDKSSRHRTGNNYIKAPVNLMQNTPEISSKYSWLSDKYKTPYFCVSSIITRIEKKRKRWGLMILLPPIGLPISLTPAIRTYYVNALVNVETGEVVYRELRVLSERPTTDVMNMMVYDSFRLMKRTQ